MELSRESKNHFVISMRSAAFELIQRREHVELSVVFESNMEEQECRCSDMFEALSRVADYWEKGELITPKGKFPWVEKK